VEVKGKSSTAQDFVPHKMESDALNMKLNAQWKFLMNIGKGTQLKV
jgi:hypothetical protein